MINPVDRLSWQEMLGHPASAGHLVDTQVNTAYNKMAALSDHIDEFKDLYDFVFRIKGWLRYYLQANYGLKDVSDLGLNNDTNGIGGDIDLFNPTGGSISGMPADGEIITKKVWRIYIKNYDEMVKASYEGLPVPNPIVRFANIYDPSKPSYLDLSYDDDGNPTFSGTFNAKDPNSFVPLRYFNSLANQLRIELAKVVSVNRSISTTTDSQGRANKRLVVSDVINFSDGSHINASGAADVPFMTKGSKVNISGDATGSGTVDDNGNININISVDGAKDYYANSNKDISTSIPGSGNNSMTIKDTYHRKNGQNVVNSQTVSLPFATYQEMVDYVNSHKESDVGSASIVAACWADEVTYGHHSITVTVPNSGKLIVQYDGKFYDPPAGGSSGPTSPNTMTVSVDGAEYTTIYRTSIAYVSSDGSWRGLLKGLSAGNHTISISGANSAKGVLFVQAVG